MTKRTFILTDQSKNSYGFIMLTSGIELSRFVKNPVMLENHDMNKVPGKWLDTRVEDTKLLADPEFDTEDPDAVKLSKKVDKGYINGASIGFIPVEFEMGMPGFEDVPVCTKSILIEASITPIPSNGNAVRLYDNEGNVMSDIQIQNKLSILSKNKPEPKIENMKELSFIIAALNMPATATQEEVVAKIKQLSADLKTEQDAKAALQTKLDAAQGTITNHNEQRVTDLVEGAIAAGKLTAGQKDTYVKLAKADFESTKSVIEAIKPHKTLSTQLTPEGSEADKDPRKDWTFDDWSRKDSKGLLSMKHTAPEKYKALYDGFYKKS